MEQSQTGYKPQEYASDMKRIGICWKCLATMVLVGVGLVVIVGVI